MDHLIAVLTEDFSALDELAVIYFMEKDYDKAYEYILECVEAYELAYTMGAAKYEYPNSLFQQTLILERNGKYLEAYDVSLKSYKLLNELVKQNLSFLSAEQRDEYWSTMQYRFSNEYPNLFYKYYFCFMANIIWIYFLFISLKLGIIIAGIPFRQK